jgi:glucokinase
VIAQIAQGEVEGNREAALAAYRSLGEIAGDAMAQALTLVDGLAVIGGGLSKSHRLFLPTLMNEVNDTFVDLDGRVLRRLTAVAFNLEDPAQLDQFLQGHHQEIQVPGSNRKVRYDSLQRIGVGLSLLGTSEAVALGAYAIALQKLDSVATDH